MEASNVLLHLFVENISSLAVKSQVCGHDSEIVSHKTDVHNDG